MPAGGRCAQRMQRRRRRCRTGGHPLPRARWTVARTRSRRPMSAAAVDPYAGRELTCGERPLLGGAIHKSALARRALRRPARARHATRQAAASRHGRRCADRARGERARPTARESASRRGVSRGYRQAGPHLRVVARRRSCGPHRLPGRAGDDSSARALRRGGPDPRVDGFTSALSPRSRRRLRRVQGACSPAQEHRCRCLIGGRHAG